mmetsp:Transcript_11046/g.41188  ORF Transcript_11046/g.41188 Transcript_11046/m.41188 type:complete len:173 (-) Transcript_11046:4442-4960(-)
MLPHIRIQIACLHLDWTSTSPPPSITLKLSCIANASTLYLLNGSSRLELLAAWLMTDRADVDFGDTETTPSRALAFPLAAPSRGLPRADVPDELGTELFEIARLIPMFCVTLCIAVLGVCVGNIVDSLRDFVNSSLADPPGVLGVTTPSTRILYNTFSPFPFKNIGPRHSKS